MVWDPLVSFGAKQHQAMAQSAMAQNANPSLNQLFSPSSLESSKEDSFQACLKTCLGEPAEPKAPTKLDFNTFLAALWQKALEVIKVLWQGFLAELQKQPPAGLAQKSWIA